MFRRKPDDGVHIGRPSARWAVMEKFIIRGKAGDPYLIRWRIVHTPYFGVLLHKIIRPDEDPVPHDHPWSFATLILRGGYTEEVMTDAWYRIDKWGIGSVHRFKRGMYHRILALRGGGPCWTLVLTGPRRDSWGFLVNGVHVNWKEYLGVD